LVKLRIESKKKKKTRTIKPGENGEGLAHQKAITLTEEGVSTNGRGVFTGS